MNKLVLLLALVLLVTGCASTIEPTSIPVNVNPDSNPNPTPLGVAPLAAPSSTVALQPSGACQSKISGRVLDAAGALVKGASIDSVASNIKGAPPKASSDDNGLYGFAGLCAGTYNFNVTAPGKRIQALKPNTRVDGANSVKVDLTIK